MLVNYKNYAVGADGSVLMNIVSYIPDVQLNALSEGQPDNDRH